MFSLALAGWDEVWIGLTNPTLSYCYDDANWPCDGVFWTMDGRHLPASVYNAGWLYDANGRWNDFEVSFAIIT